MGTNEIDNQTENASMALIKAGEIAASPRAYHPSCKTYRKRSLVSTIMSLSFGVLYIVHFDNMHIPLGLGMLSPQLPLTFINRKHKDRINNIEILGRLGPLCSPMHLDGLVRACLDRHDNVLRLALARRCLRRNTCLSPHMRNLARVSESRARSYISSMELWRAWAQTARCTETGRCDESCFDYINLHGFICLRRKFHCKIILLKVLSMRLIPHLKLKHTTVCNLIVFNNRFICPSTINSERLDYILALAPAWRNDVQWVQ
jgi:hypothetical protein